MGRPRRDPGSAGTGALQRYLRQFLTFFFPAIAADIDWDRGYDALDKEFQQIIRRARVGKGLADKLFNVGLRDGSEHWLLIHIEVQGAYEKAFPERMFRCNMAAYATGRTWCARRTALLSRPDGSGEPSYGYMITCRSPYALYNREVVSLAVLCDEDPDWRPHTFA